MRFIKRCELNRPGFFCIYIYLDGLVNRMSKKRKLLAIPTQKLVGPITYHFHFSLIADNTIPILVFPFFFHLWDGLVDDSSLKVFEPLPKITAMRVCFAPHSTMSADLVTDLSLKTFDRVGWAAKAQSARSEAQLKLVIISNVPIPVFSLYDGWILIDSTFLFWKGLEQNYESNLDWIFFPKLEFGHVRKKIVIIIPANSFLGNYPKIRSCHNLYPGRLNHRGKAPMMSELYSDHNEIKNAIQSIFKLIWGYIAILQLLASNKFVKHVSLY